MLEIKFPCSGCGVSLRIGNPELAGKKIKCPKCAAINVIPASTAKSADCACPAKACRGNFSTSENQLSRSAGSQEQAQIAAIRVGQRRARDRCGAASKPKPGGPRAGGQTSPVGKEQAGACGRRGARRR